MFDHVRKPKSQLSSAFAVAEIVYHSVVRSIRSQHGNAFIAIGINVMQALLFVGAFLLLFSVLGLRSAALRGDFLLYLMSGIFLFLAHTRAFSAVAGAEAPTSAMMQHAPMTTHISILSAALGSLYIQIFTLVLILFGYHIVWTPVYIHDPIPAFGMLILGWFTGCSIGLVLLALRPWFPQTVNMLRLAYMRVNMIASGKMFVANTLPSFMLAMFDWNPLFHAIDQARGYTFENYFPRYSSWEYAFAVGAVFLVIGLLAESYTRRHASVSWGAKQ